MRSGEFSKQVNSGNVDFDQTSLTQYSNNFAGDGNDGGSIYLSSSSASMKLLKFFCQWCNAENANHGLERLWWEDPRQTGFV